MKSYLLLCSFFFLTLTSSNAQGGRFFIDIPAFYIQAADFSKINQAFGLGTQLGASFGGHHYKIGLAGGVDANASLAGTGKFSEKIGFNPYAQFELGAGLFRTNGQKCAVHNHNAYTAMPVGIVRYDFSTKKMAVLAGAQLSYFNIRDMVKNTELFLNLNYDITNKAAGGALGMRVFFNLNNIE